MKRPNIIAIFIAILLLGGMVCWNIAIVTNYNTDKDIVASIERKYDGKIFFTDELEYNKFKNELATREDIQILALDELSSDNPLVIFSIEVEGDKDFLYGTMVSEKLTYKMSLNEFVALCLVANIIGLYLIVLCMLVSPAQRKR